MGCCIFGVLNRSREKGWCQVYIGVEEIGQIDLRFLEQRAELSEAVPLAASLEKTREGGTFRTGMLGRR